jgi:hypothetical protein
MNNQHDKQVVLLSKKFTKIDANVIHYVLNVIAGGNVKLATETLQSLPQDQIDMLAAQFNQESLSTDQKEIIKDFKSITGVTTKTAEKYLRQNAWRIDEAMNAFFNAGGEEAGEIFEEQDELKKLFEKYQSCDNMPNSISFKGIKAFCIDLEIDIQEMPILVICWKLKAKTPYVITKTEFIDEFSDLECKSLSHIVEKIPQWKSEALSKFDDFYEFVYEFSTINGQNMLSTVAIKLWTTILREKWEHGKSWCLYLKHRQWCVLGISRLYSFTYS